MESLEQEVTRLRARVAELEFYIYSFKEDLDKYTLIWPFHLTPSEADILALMLKHKGRVLTKEALWIGLYGLRNESDMPDIRVLDVLMCKLRKKLKVYDIYLEAIWGRGFMITHETCDKLMALTKPLEEFKSGDTPIARNIA